MIRHIAANLMTILIVFLLAMFGVYSWAKLEVNRDGPLAESKVIPVEKGDSLQIVSDRLEAEGAIKDARLFRVFAKYKELDKALKFAEYEIPAHASINEILGIVTSGRGVALRVVIPEGYSSWQVVQRLKEAPELVCDIETIPPEGSLAPNTYDYARGENCEKLIARMTEIQANILAEAWANRADDLPLKSPEEVLILASIVEKETGVPEERPQVASVFENRLKQGIKLQTDPTIIYGITKGEGSLGRGIRRSELEAKTPYNTYVIPGLPPTPIANPGKAAIEATVNPAETDYIYFVADGTGGHAFAKTLQEHNENVKKWREIEAAKKNKTE